MDIADERRRHAKGVIVKQLKRYLRNAREKEQLVLQGLAAEFCQSTGLAPEQVELVVREHPSGEVAFHFRKRDGALILPKGAIV